MWGQVASLKGTAAPDAPVFASRAGVTASRVHVCAAITLWRVYDYSLAKVLTMRGNDRSDENSLHCSFCRKSQKRVGKLISSPGSDSPRAYICDECVTICAAIVEDDKIEAEYHRAEDEREGVPPHPILAHKRASDLMVAVERWVREQSLGSDGLAAEAEVRRIARAMFK